MRQHTFQRTEYPDVLGARNSYAAIPKRDPLGEHSLCHPREGGDPVFRHRFNRLLDSRLRGNDKRKRSGVPTKLIPLQAFEHRDIDRALSVMRADVVWANGMEGGFVHGHEAVREYWTRQWQQIDPRVEPRHFESQGNRLVVDVHQLVRDMNGGVLADQMAKHVFTIDRGVISKFEIA